jgi:putative glutamine amidotransferase
MTLRIGISARLLHNPPGGLGLPQKRLQFLESSMAHWIMAHGAIALMVPFVDEETPLTANRAPMTEIVDLLDGLVLQGGIDICPETYGDTLRDPAWAGDYIRDSYELKLLRGFIEAGKPVLGVCRGAQLINVYFGGSLVQDIPSLRPGAAQHQDTQRYDRLMHDVHFEEGSSLHRLYGNSTPHRVTSIHHQCVDRLGQGLKVEARSPQDGIIEAIRHEGPGYVLGVQWHPEFHLSSSEETQGLLDSGPMMKDFLRAARASAKRHQRAAQAVAQAEASVPTAS